MSTSNSVWSTLPFAEQVAVEVALEQAISRHIGFARYFRSVGARHIARDSIARARTIVSAGRKLGLTIIVESDPHWEVGS